MSVMADSEELIEVLSPTRSTKGASKQRRDLINAEIDNLKDALPLPDSIRQRLFQLQTLKGFVILITRQGKLLYVSENVADYLGHSVEEILSQGDSLYDIIDYRDHAAVQTELLSGPPSLSLGYGLRDEKVFLCRMTLSRAARRQPQYQKFIIVRGRYLHPAEYYQALMNLSGAGPYLHPVFAGLCGPLITPETADSLLAGHTCIFSTTHNMDMKFVHIDQLCEYHLGYPNDYLRGRSWYTFLHPNDVVHASEKHKQLCDDKETSCILLVRLKTVNGTWLWLHTVLCLREGCVHDENVQHQIIMATYQMLGDLEAATVQANRWIYQPCASGPLPSQTTTTAGSFLFPFAEVAHHRLSFDAVPAGGGLHQRSKSEDLLTLCDAADVDAGEQQSWLELPPAKPKRRGSKQQPAAQPAMHRSASTTKAAAMGTAGRPPPRRSSLTTQLEIFHEVNSVCGGLRPYTRNAAASQSDDIRVNVVSPALTPALGLAPAPALAEVEERGHSFSSGSSDGGGRRRASRLNDALMLLTPPDTSPSDKSSVGSRGSSAAPGAGMYAARAHPSASLSAHPLHKSLQASLSHPTLLRHVDDALPEIDSSSVEAFLRKVEQEEEPDADEDDYEAEVSSLSASWSTASHQLRYCSQQPQMHEVQQFASSHQFEMHAATAATPAFYDDSFYRYHAGSNGSLSSSEASSSRCASNAAAATASTAAGAEREQQLLLAAAAAAAARVPKYDLTGYDYHNCHIAAALPPLPVFSYDTASHAAAAAAAAGVAGGGASNNFHRARSLPFK